MPISRLRLAIALPRSAQVCVGIDGGGPVKADYAMPRRTMRPKPLSWRSELAALSRCAYSLPIKPFQQRRQPGSDIRIIPSKLGHRNLPSSSRSILGRRLLFRAKAGGPSETDLAGRHGVYPDSGLPLSGHQHSQSLSALAKLDRLGRHRYRAPFQGSQHHRDRLGVRSPQ